MNDGQIPDQQPEPDKQQAPLPTSDDNLMLSGLSNTGGLYTRANISLTGRGSWIHISAIVLLFLSLLGFTGRIFWWADLLGYPRLHLLALTSLLGLYYLVSRKWQMVVLCSVGILCNAVALDFALPLQASPLSAAASNMPPGEIKVATLNVNVNNRNTAGVVAWVRGENPDILLLVEANHQWMPIADDLMDILPYRRIADNSNNYGLILLSRFPLDNTNTTRAGPYSLPILSATAETPIGQITVIGAHPNFALSADDYQALRMYMAQIGAMARSNTMPTLVMGDFATVPWSLSFEPLRTLPNLQPEIWKLPATWPAYWDKLGLPLDLILLTLPPENKRSLTIAEMVSGPQIMGTNHLPLIARIKIP